MLRTMTDEVRRQRWEDRADWPLTITAVLFLVAYAVPILRPDLASPWPTVCRLVTWAAWALFVVDYVARLALSRGRVAFVRGNLLDLAVVALPMLRPLRLLRLVALLSILNRATGGSVRGRVIIYVAGATSLVLFIGSLAVLEAERGVKSALTASFPTTVVRISRPAVVVEFAGGDETWEVIPGFIRSGSSSKLVYDIPGPSSGWIDSAPKEHLDYVNECNTKAGVKGGAKKLARLIKAWKYHNNVPISSF